MDWQEAGERQAIAEMTLRDFFAALALQGILAEDAEGYTFMSAAAGAYEMADAMLQERAK